MEFIKKHFDLVIQCIGLLLVSALTFALVAAFRADLLPFASDGNAFDTVYAVEDTDNNTEKEQ